MATDQTTLTLPRPDGLVTRLERVTADALADVLRGLERRRSVAADRPDLVEQPRLGHPHVSGDG